MSGDPRERLLGGVHKIRGLVSLGATPKRNLVPPPGARRSPRVQLTCKSCFKHSRRALSLAQTVPFRTAIATSPRTCSLIPGQLTPKTNTERAAS